MTVRAKFKVQSVTEFAPTGTERNGSIVLSAVVSGSDENKSFWKYTPSGRIEIQTINGAAIDQFKAGDEFYVDFTKAD